MTCSKTNYFRSRSSMLRCRRHKQTLSSSVASCNGHPRQSSLQRASPCSPEVETQRGAGPKDAKSPASSEVIEGVLADGNPAVQVGLETERARNTRKDKDKRDHSQVCCGSATRYRRSLTVRRREIGEVRR